MSQHTLFLDNDWDLHVDSAGNIPHVYDAYSVAQNVANAFKLFTNDAWYFEERGIAHFLIELNEHPRINILKVRLKETALNVDGVADCEIQIVHLEGRDLSGVAKLTLTDGQEIQLEIK